MYHRQVGFLEASFMIALRLYALAALLASLTPAHLPAQAPRDSLVVSPAWLAARLTEPRLVVLQVERNPAAYLEAHVPGARLIPFAKVVTERGGLPNELPPVDQLDSLLEAAGVSDDSRLVIVGEPLMAARLFFTLDYLGAGDRASLLDGGLPAWRAAGHLVSTEVPAVIPGHFTPKPRPELVVDADWIRARLGDPALVLLDARPGAEFRGNPPGDGVPRGGHLPGAHSFFWRLTLTAPEPASLKPHGVLEKLLGRVGVEPGRELVTYCRTGVQASYLYFVLRTLGHRPRLYDGSYLDWSRRTELPVE
jgi:thiosulfate/3-mercaptopyruvate sulfurtransferase